MTEKKKMEEIKTILIDCLKSKALAQSELIQTTEDIEQKNVISILTILILNFFFEKKNFFFFLIILNLTIKSFCYHHLKKHVLN